MIGCLATEGIIVVRLDGDPSFAELLTRAQVATAQARERWISPLPQMLRELGYGGGWSRCGLPAFEVSVFPHPAEVISPEPYREDDLEIIVLEGFAS